MNNHLVALITVVAMASVRRYERQRVVSARTLDLTRLDCVGYVTVSTAQHALLEQYVSGAISLTPLISQLEAGATP